MNRDPRYAALEKKYPVILGNFLEGRGLEVQPGWLPLIDDTCQKLRRFTNLIDQTVTIGLIKSKFGEMRMQGVEAPGMGVSDREIIIAIISRAEGLSRSICTVCGEFGYQKSDTGCYRVLCVEHHEERGD